MNREKVREEHAQLKERLAELVDFINSEEYYKLSDSEKQLIATQRTGMELYLNALSVRLWGNTQSVSPLSSSLMSLMLSSMFTSSYGFPSSTPSGTEVLKKSIDDDNGHELS